MIKNRQHKLPVCGNLDEHRIRHIRPAIQHGQRDT